MTTAAASSRPVSAAILPTSNGRETFERYSPLVRRIAMRLVRRLPPSIDLDDLVSAGWIGVGEALPRCAANMPAEEVDAFVSHRVRGAMLDYLRSLDPMSRRLRGESRRVAAASRSLSSRLGRAPDDAELAKELGVPLDEYQSLSMDLVRSETTSVSLSEVPGPMSARDQAPDELAERRELALRVAGAIERLPERLKLVVGLYYQEECSLKEIGEILGVTESRICQLHGEAMTQVRRSLEGTPQARAGGCRVASA